MIQKWPTTTRQNKKAEKEFATVQNIVTGIRTIRNITRTPHTTKLHIRMSSKKTKFIDEHGAIIKNLTNTETCTACSPKDLRPTLTFPGLILDLQLGAEAQTLLHAEVARLQKDVARLSSLLANAGFKKNAPLSVIKENTEKLQNAEEALKHLHGA